MDVIDRRSALKSLAALAGAAGLSVTPVTTSDAADVSMVILKSPRRLSLSECERIRAGWINACAGTNLERAKVVVHDCELEIEFVRGRG